MNTVVIYPSEIDTDRAKLAACRSLIKQAIDEYNSTSAKSEGSPARFRAYANIHLGVIRALLHERNNLVENLWRWNYSGEQYKGLSDSGADALGAAYQRICGDKALDYPKKTKATSSMLDSLKQASQSLLEPSDPTENFNSYTEVDPQSDVTIDSASQITAKLYNFQYPTYVYYDKGVNHFSGNFTHLYGLKATAGYYGRCQYWAMSNLLGDRGAIVAASENQLGLQVYPSSGSALTFAAEEIYLGTQYVDTSITLVVGTQYYITIVRDESIGTYGQFDAYICTGNYYGQGGSTLIDAVAVNLHAKIDFRYIYGVQNWCRTSAFYSYYITGIITNLDLQETPTVSTQAVSGIGLITATGNGTIVSTGADATCDKRGFVYSTSSHGDPGNVAPGSSGYESYIEQTGSFGTGAYTERLSLVPGTTYYVRAYAHNSVGYSYGGEVTFQSLSPKFSVIGGHHIINVEGGDV